MNQSSAVTNSPPPSPPPPCDTKLTTAVHTRSTAFTLSTLSCTGRNRNDRNCRGMSAELVTTLALRVGRYTALRLGSTRLRRGCPSRSPVATMPVHTNIPSRKTESATAVDIAVGDAVAADNDDSVNAVVPPSSIKDEDAYVGASVAFEGMCVGAFADGAAAANVTLSRCCHRRSLHAAATAMPPSCCMAASAAVAAARSEVAGHSV